MKKAIFVLFLSLLSAYAFGGVGNYVDKRRVIGWVDSKPAYVSANQQNMWNTAPYNSIVLINNGRNSYGTGEFISPKHILTNTHVAQCCGCKDADGSVRKKCSITTSDGSVLDASVVAYGARTSEDIILRQDWSILEVENYCSKNHFTYTTNSHITSGVLAPNLWQAGFGELRILSENDIKNIRAAYREWIKTSKNIPEDWNNAFQGNVVLDISKNGRDAYKVFFDKYREITGKDFVSDCFRDFRTLKRNDNCSIFRVTNGIGYHNCQTWHGDSGSTLQTPSNEIQLLHRGGGEYITHQKSYVNHGPTAAEIFSRPDVIELLSKPCRVRGK